MTAKKQWDVTITARITKTVRVSAGTEDEARDEAHSCFDATCTDINEKYQEDVDKVEEVK